MAVKLFHAYKVEDRIAVKIYLVEDEEYSILGKVVEVSMYGFGGHHYDFFYKFSDSIFHKFDSCTALPLTTREIFQEFQENLKANW